MGREWVATHRRLHPESGAAEIEVGGGAAIHVSPDSKLTKVLGLGMKRPVVPEDFERIEAFYCNRSPRIIVEASPFADPSLLHELGRRGYRPAGWKQILVRPLEERDAALGQMQPPGVTLEPTGPDDFETWVETVARGFEDGTEPESSARELYSVIHHAPSYVHWIVRVNGQPAAAACLARHGDVASLATTSTRVEFRGQGIHAMLIAMRLAHATAAGCSLARVSCMPGDASQRNLERAGFRVIYTRAFFGCSTAR